MAEHLLPESLRERRPIRILVIGAGGNGSQIFMGLPYLNQALRAWGHRDGLEVILMDGDIVSETNCIRQPFSMSDIGLNKASVLVNRVNLFWGLEWKAAPHLFSRKENEFNNYACDILFGCVDTRAARREIHKAVTDPHCRVGYWFDLGNNAASGQYLLGQPSNGRNRRSATRLRTISELYPEIIDVAAGEDSLPSCSAIEALERQEPYINQVLAASSLAMLARLLHYGRLTHHGAFFNAATGQMSAVPVDPTLWRKTRRRSLASLPKAA
jgi:PRTRC genetic system ThiF family protein